MLGTKILEERESFINGTIKVVNSWGLGNYIQAGGLTQSGGIVETIWKSTLNQIKKDKHVINNCLILGLGGGTLAKLLRKRYPDSFIVGVEIDPVMIEFGKKYLNLDQYNVDIQIKNANKIRLNKYDLVIVDIYQGDTYPKEFESYDFLNRVAKNKLVIFNRLYFGDKRPDTVRFGNKLEKHFKKVTWYYPEANLMFICES